MENFKLWLEQKEIQYLGHGEYAGTAWVTFAIRGKRYEYAVDPLILQPDTADGKKFAAFLRYAPGKALNMAKKQNKSISNPQGYLF